MSDIFREVDEEVRKDQLQSLWKRYGVYVIAAAVAIVVATAANVGWREYRESQRLKESDRFLSAAGLLQQGRTEAAITGFADLAETAGTGYAVLARLQEAAARAGAGDLEAAAIALDRLASDGDADRLYRDLAQLLYVMMRLDSGAPADLERRLAPLAAEGSAWRYSAQELQALLWRRQGERGRAREAFQALSTDEQAPQGVRRRAELMLAAMDHGY